MSAASPAIHLFFGADDYLVQAKARATVNALLPAAEQATSLDIVDGAADNADAAALALARCLQGLLTPGFFGARRVVWLRDASFLEPNSKVGQAEVTKARLTELVDVLRKGLPEGQILIVTAPDVDKRTSLHTICKEKGEALEFPLETSGWKAKEQATERLRDAVARLGLRLSSEAQERFLERVGADTRGIVNEVEKLALYLGDRREATAADVEAVVSVAKETMGWDLADAVGGRDLPEALACLRRLLHQKEEPMALIGTLRNRIQELLVCRHAMDRGWLRLNGRNGQWGEVPPGVDALLSKRMKQDPRKIHPFRMGKLVEQAARFTTRDLLRHQQAILAAHSQLVRSRVPQAFTLELLILRMLA